MKKIIGRNNGTTTYYVNFIVRLSEVQNGRSKYGVVMLLAEWRMQ